jgi:hypothetical protein
MTRVEQAGRHTEDRIRSVCHAVPRAVRGWPGADACVLAYAVTAAALYRHSEVQLFGLLATVAVGVGWYASPARAWEAGRRRRQAGRSK